IITGDITSYPQASAQGQICLLYTSDAADELDGVNFGSSYFFEAEDGIPNQPKSRGLGKVYKRQVVS
ncbi:hypothetical protein KWH41_24195, partial [Escherichia coli]|uniref:hypothetical protein n=1 Tax=Escherichia coli TaxID=562 RepID=UPI0021D0A10E